MSNFTYTAFNDATHGFTPVAPSDSILPTHFRDRRTDAIVSGVLQKTVYTPASFTKLTETVINANNINQLWTDDKGIIRISASYVSDGAGKHTILISISNTSGVYVVGQLGFKLPEITTPSPGFDKLSTGSLGGTTSALGNGNTGTWPGTSCFAAVSFYNNSSSKTLGFTFLNPQINQTELVWFAGTNGDSSTFLNSFLRIVDNNGSSTGNLILPGESRSYRVDYNEYTSREAHWDDYAQKLASMMNFLGYPTRAVFTAVTPWGRDDFGTNGSNMTAAVQAAVTAYSIKGWMEDPPADGSSFYYQPDPCQIAAMYASISTTKAIATLTNVGVLVVPDISPLIPTDDALAQFLPAPNQTTIASKSYLNVNQNADATRQYNLNLWKVLKAAGCTILYADTGGSVIDKDTMAWLQTAYDAKVAGLPLMHEGASDVLMWITGVAKQFPYGKTSRSDVDYAMLKRILSGVMIFGEDNAPTQINDGHGLERWWTTCLRDGFCPLLSNNTAHGANGNNQLYMWKNGL